VKKNTYLITIIKELDKKTNPFSGKSSSLVESASQRLSAIIRFSDTKPLAVTITGKVTSDINESLPGVNVLVKGTSTGTTTNAEGNYSLSVPDANGTLIFSYIGYTSQEVAINGRSIIDVTLVPDVKTLSEVVVIGYGTQERRDVTSSISSVSSKEIAATPITSFDQALQGRAAGVLVSQTSGRPGAPIAVRVRGFNTLQNNDPLYVIDGVPVFTESNNDSQNNILATINPNDIESIEVLKDASATAIYGTRAAGGVVLITTKRGKAGKPRITFDSYYGTQTAIKTLDVITDSREFMNLSNEIMRNGAQTPFPVFDPSHPNYNNLLNNTDWQDAIFRTAPIQNYSLNVSGGSENATYSISGGFFDQKGIIRESDFKRYSFRINSDINAGSKFKFGESINFSYTNQFGESNPETRADLRNAATFSPTIPRYDPTAVGGLGQGSAPYVGRNIDERNPLLFEIQDRTDLRYRVLGNIFGEYEIIKGLKYRLNLGLDIMTGFNMSFSPPFDQGNRSTPLAERNDDRRFEYTWIVENLLSYDKTLGRHSFTILGGITQQKYTTSFLQVVGREFPNGNVTNIGSAREVNQYGGKTERAYLSYLSRVLYSYADKYLLTASYRVDGSSRFAPANRFAGFPAVSLGWRLSKEDFMQTVPLISNLKLRGSWGKTGNESNLIDFAYITGIDTDISYVIGKDQTKVPGGRPNNIGNNQLQWETSTQTDVGIDVGLFQDRLTFTADYFVKRTTDLIVNPPLPEYLGVSPLRAPFRNVGEVKNNGLEFSIGYNKNQGEFTYSFSGNFSTINNEIISLGSGLKQVEGQSLDEQIITRTEPGRELGYFYGYVTDGVFDSDDEAKQYGLQPNAKGGDIKFKDIAGPDGSGPDGRLTPDDRTYLGSAIPDFFYGFNASLGYKGFDFSLFFQGTQGNEIYNYLRRDLERMDSPIRNSSVSVRNRWTPDNTTANMPRAVAGDPNQNNRTSDRFIEDGSYLRLKNIQFGYSLPANILGRMGSLSQVRVYASAQNLLTFTKYDGVDPEIQSNVTAGSRREFVFNNGVDQRPFPSARVFLLGLQVGF
jgi:TonB-linked SusC/RagA family outer membrane protein